MLIAQFYSDKTNQPHGRPEPITATLCRGISDASGKHTPNGVLGELRQGFAVAVPGGFYMASENGED